jgi:nitrogen regulatory protein P-II 1
MNGHAGPLFSRKSEGEEGIPRKELSMKRIETIVGPDRVVDLCAALDAVGHQGITISSVEGVGHTEAWTHHVRSGSYRDSARSRSRVEVVVEDKNADRTIRAIQDAAVAGGSGDGSIFVHDLAEVIRIRTNESGAAAL